MAGLNINHKVARLAGALTDATTVKAAADLGYDLYRMLMEHDISGVLQATGDEIITGPTGTNVNDLVVVVL